MEPKQSIAKSSVEAEVRGALPEPAGGNPPTDILIVNPIRLAYRLNYVANFYTGPLYKQVEQRWGLSRPDYITLFCLLQMPGLKAKDIVAICGRPKNSISRAVNGLMARGYVQRDETDAGRGQPLSLTPEGDAIAREILPLFVSREANMLEPLTEAERQTLDTILGKLCFRQDGWNSVY